MVSSPSFAAGAGAFSTVVPCFVAFFRAGSGSEAFTDIPDGGLPSSGTAIAPMSASAAMAVAAAATIGHGLGCVFGIITDTLSLICLGCDKDLWSWRSKCISYVALRGCDLGARDCLQVW